MRCGEARHADASLAVSQIHERVASLRRLNESACDVRLVCWSPVRAIVGATDRSCAHERPVISSASASNIRRPTSVMRPGNALSRRSATDSSLRGLARRWVLPSVRRATLMGFTSALRRLAPASGGRSSLIVRAHVPVRRNRSPRLVFVGCFDSFDRDRSGTRLDWLLGLIPFCGPFLTAIVRLAARSFPPWAFASCRVCGHIEVHSDGLDPARIIKPQGPRRISSNRSSRSHPSSAPGLSLPCSRGNERSLQRVRGPDALPLRAFSSLARKGLPV
jgi:hypothetical protein